MKGSNLITTHTSSRSTSISTAKGNTIKMNLKKNLPPKDPQENEHKIIDFSNFELMKIFHKYYSQTNAKK